MNDVSAEAKKLADAGKCLNDAAMKDVKLGRLRERRFPERRALVLLVGARVLRGKGRQQETNLPAEN